MTTADLILKNANVITVDPGQPSARLVAIRGDRIWLVTGGDSLERVRGTNSRVIDCQGKTLVPGFNDAHCHVFSLLRKLLSIDLSPASVSSISDIKKTIRRAAQQTPGGQWLRGTDYNDFYLADQRHPTRRDIDEVAPHHPVVLAHRSLHACVLNSRALALAGINKETAEPPGGRIDRDPHTGEPTGLLFEMLGDIREKVMPSLSEEEINTSIALANRHYLSLGITSLGEATVVNSLNQWRKFQSIKEGGRLKSRLYLMPGIEALGQFQEAGFTPRWGNPQLRLGSVKVMLTETGGQLYPPQALLNELALAVHRAGFQLAFHAVQPSTVAAAIIALEFAHSQLPGAGRRHRIEHCSECPPHLLERLARLEAVVVTQPPFVYYSGERYLATVPEDQQPWLYRMKSLLDSGLVVAASSDSPLVPDNPLVGIYAAVTREAESGQYLLPEEAISARQALAMYTINGAYASFEEDIKGSIIPGKLGDVVLLSDDPLRTPPQQVKDIKVEMTIIGGEVVWEA